MIPGINAGSGGISQAAKSAAKSNFGDFGGASLTFGNRDQGNTSMLVVAALAVAGLLAVVTVVKK